jgi:homoserine O-acetyltransferase
LRHIVPSAISPRTLERPDQAWPGYRLLVDEPLRLDCGVDLGSFTIAYQTYGKLNADRSNAILICHALTGDHYVADPHPITGHDGWWMTMVGPGLVLDTERYFLICANVLGGCMGSTGPKEIDRRPVGPGRCRFRSSPCATWCGRKSA